MQSDLTELAFSVEPSRPPVAEVMLYGGEWHLLVAHLTVHRDHVDRFVLVEADHHHDGSRRTPELESRLADLPVESERVRLLSISLDPSPSITSGRRERIQRDAGFIGIADLPSDALVILSDVDEILRPSEIDVLGGSVVAPTRIGLSARLGFVDRLAGGWHCCGHLVPPELRRHDPRRRPFLFPGPVACRRAHLGPPGPNSPFALRRRTTALDHRERGWHFTSVDPVTRAGAKERVGAHAARGRSVDPDHVHRCIAAGVHHDGWWYATALDADELEFEVRAVADLVPGATAPDPLPPMRNRRALRAWCEVRLHPRVPDAVVARIDRRFDEPGPVTTTVFGVVDRLLLRRSRRLGDTASGPTAAPDAHGHDHSGTGETADGGGTVATAR